MRRGLPLLQHRRRRLAALSFSKDESCLNIAYTYLDLYFYRVWIESRGAEYDEDKDYDYVSLF